VKEGGGRDFKNQQNEGVPNWGKLVDSAHPILSNGGGTWGVPKHYFGGRQKEEGGERKKGQVAFEWSGGRQSDLKGSKKIYE